MINLKKLKKDSPFYRKNLFLFFLLVGCGTNTGNPLAPKPDDGSDTSKEAIDLPGEDTTTVTNSIDGEPITLPSLSLSLPESLSSDEGSQEISLLGKGEKCTNIMTCSIRRARKSLKSINAILGRLANDDGVSKGGRFKQKGPQKTISGRVIGIEHEVYSHQAEICAGGNPMLLARWNKEKTKMMFIRNHRFRPLKSGSESSSLGKIIVEDSETSKLLKVFYQGATYKNDDKPTDGDYIREATVIDRQKESGAIKIKGVSDWLSDKSIETIAGDNYFAGQVDQNADGYFIGYRKALTRICSQGFDEKREDLFVIDRSRPGFCYARNAKTKEAARKADYASISESLKDVGILEAKILKEFSLKFTKKCP